MFIGVPKEIKKSEQRVGLTPDSVFELAAQGHSVFIERDAGVNSGFSNQDYLDRGASLCDDADSLFDAVEMIIKVKEPQLIELNRLKASHTIFTYLHLAPDPEQASGLLSSGATAIAYESVEGVNGDLPLLTPMSQVAGRLSIQSGARCLEASMGGRGVLLGGVPGVPQASVVVIGGGAVGSNAVAVAVGLGADVTVLDRDVNVLNRISELYGTSVHTLYSTSASIYTSVVNADLVIGAVLVRGAKAPKLVTSEMVRNMRAGAAIVDVAIDQGGCVETARPTTHANPVYTVDGVVHYCVTNMPSAVPRTATQALNNATLPYIAQLAAQGPVEAMRSNNGLMAGLTVYDGHITEPAVAADLGLQYYPPEELLGVS